MDTHPRNKLGLGIVALAIGVACGGSEKPSTPAPSSPAAGSATTDAPSRSAPKPKGPRGPIDPAKVGTITGVVAFEGAPPERKTLSTNTGGCPAHDSPLLDESAIVAGGKLANVFVHIKDGLSGWDLPPVAADAVELDQKGCQYLPHVLGMRTNGILRVHNSDPTSHNVNIRSNANERANPVQAPGSKAIEWKPTKKELGVPFECSLHPWMKSFVCVVDDPWFAVSGPDGAFTLTGVPPGDYVLEAWHEKYGKRTAEIALEPGGNATATFTFQAR